MGIGSRLTTSATHKTKSRVSNGRGGNAVTFSTVGSVSCRISMKSATERSRANREEGLGTYKIFVLASETIEVHDQLVVGSTVYEIVGLSYPSRGDHIELEAERVDVGS